MPRSLTVVHIASECAPYVKSGGLGDVVSALPKALSKLGHRVSIIIPYYGLLKKQNLNTSVVAADLSITIGRKQYSATVKKLTTDNGVPVFFIDNKTLFSKLPGLYGYPNDGLRFLFFNVAALTFLDRQVQNKLDPLFGRGVDVLHCHDWHSALIPQMLTFNHHFVNLKTAATVFTIHNLAFQGPSDWWTVPPRFQDSGRCDPCKVGVKPKFLNFTKRGIMYADAINTVSERYALEILTPEFGQGLDRLLRSKRNKVFGIINGIDYAVFNPKFDPHIYIQYDADSIFNKKENKIKLQQTVGLQPGADLPLIGMVNRLTEQKGFELMMQVMPFLLKLPMQLIVAGTGDKGYTNFFRAIAQKYPKKVATSCPFTEEMASKIYAASDIYLMPSRFEPCGISQLISLRYGSVPIVHETGGLHDTITNFNPRTRQGNGFIFSSYTKEDFLIAIVRALETYQYPEVWNQLATCGMEESFSWELPAKKYLQLYRLAIKKK